MSRAKPYNDKFVSPNELILNFLRQSLDPRGYGFGADHFVDDIWSVRHKALIPRVDFR